MPEYRRAIIPGGMFFFTLAIADRSDDLLVREVDRLRRVYQSIQARYPFETIAIIRYLLTLVPRRGTCPGKISNR